MTLQDEQRLVRQAMDHALSGLQEDAWLAQRILAHTKGEEPVKRKLSVVTILVLAILCISVTGALAAALNAWGLLDFASGHFNVYVPENAADAIRQEDMRIETGHVVCTVQESFYDGKTLFLTARVTPKEKVLLIGDSAYPNEPLGNLYPTFEAESMSIGQYALAVADGRMAEITLNAQADGLGSMQLNEDGSVTLFAEYFFEEEQPEREVEMWLGYVPLMDVAGLTAAELESEDVEVYDMSARERTAFTLPLTAAQTQATNYPGPMDFPGVGVQVTNVALTVTPLEIRYELQYTVTDLEKYLAQENGLWFEFIDPAITSSEPFDQCVSSGLSGLGSVSRLDDSDFAEAKVGARYSQVGAIGLNAQSDRYTLRAYNCLTRARYETVQFDEGKAE